MGLWRDLLRLLGLSNDARVHISAPGVDVEITGEPELVRQLLVLVKGELERNPRLREAMRRERHQRGGSQMRRRTPQYVQPTELDEMDSPYALADALVVPVEESTDEHAPEREAPRPPAPRRPAEERMRPQREVSRAFAGEPATLVPDAYVTPEPPSPAPAFYEAATGTAIAAAQSAPMQGRPAVERGQVVHESGDTRIDSNPNVGEEEGEREVTAISPSPNQSGPVQGPAIMRGSSSPFITDGGPTITPSSDPDVRRRGDSDPDDTRETERR